MIMDPILNNHLTPEQQAELVGLGTYCQCGRDRAAGTHESYCPIARIAVAIRAAVRAERKACAAIAAWHYTPFEPDGEWSGAGEGEKIARAIEQAILARNQQVIAEGRNNG